jgi:hypothetical protein
MQTIADSARQPLTWTQPSALKQFYELRSGDVVVATLAFRSMWGTLATAQSGDGCWTFKRVGFWQNKATVRACGADAEHGMFRNDTWQGGGTLELSDGSRFRATTNAWLTKYELQTDAGETLVRFRLSAGLHLSADVEVQPAALTLRQLPVLVLFGWYLAVMLNMDSGAVAAVTSA